MKVIQSLIAVVAIAASVACVSAPVKSLIGIEKIIKGGVNLPYDAEVEYLESTTKGDDEMEHAKTTPAEYDWITE